MMRRIAVLSLLFVVTISAEDLPRLSEVLEVSIVNLEVVVTDRQGNRVHGLTKDDFEIREGGKPQAITNFAEYRGAEGDAGRTGVEAGAAAAPAAPRPKRAIILAFEQQYMLPLYRDPWFAALSKFIDTAMQPGDHAMVVTMRGLIPLSVQQAMTSDRAAIHTALDLIARGLGPQPADSAVASLQEVQQRAAGDRALAAMGGEARNRPDELCGLQQKVAIRRKATALGALMNSLGALEGRKILVMAMRRFGMNAGVECGAASSDYDTIRIRQELIQTANANGFTIYTMNPGIPKEQFDTAESGQGIDDSLQAMSVFLNENQALIGIAHDTGGDMQAGPVDIVKLLPLIVEALDSYYSLGYRGDGRKLDRTRNVAVTVKRKELTVRTRTQVVEKSEETRMKDRVIAALSYVADPGTITPAVKTAAVRKQGRNRFTLPITVQVPIGQLITVREGDQQRGAFSLFIGGGNGEILFSDVTKRTQILTIPDADLARAKQAHFTYDVDLTIDGKVNRIAVAVYDEVGHEYGVVRIEVTPQEP